MEKWTEEMVTEFGDYLRERVLFYKEYSVDIETQKANFLKSKEGPKKMTRDDLKRYEHNMCVGQLLEFIEEHDISKDALVLVQRIEDRYFERNNWDVYEKDQTMGGFQTTAQYHPAWCPVFYKDEGKDLLFIDLHY